MNYTPFLDMHILVSDDFLAVLPPIIEALVYCFLAVLLSVVAFVWIYNHT